jgi:hypothetical protein
MESTVEELSERAKVLAERAIQRYREAPDRPPIEVTQFKFPRRSVYLMYPTVFAPHRGSGKYHWFCGYNREGTLFLDGFTGEAELDLEQFLQYIDNMPLTLRVKGGSVQANWHRVVITSPHSIEELYAETLEKRPELREPLARRLADFQIVVS